MTTLTGRRSALQRLFDEVDVAPKTTFKQYRTKVEIKGLYFGHNITIPAGSLCSNKTAMGFDDNYIFLEDLSCCPEVKHDAIYRGIQLTSDQVTRI
jgi:hypothetical protein